ncbi:MAG TPA: LuxR C-terminal-related transcriptional regulator [Egicoccus sp.]|nr:LuxR C-terminal-related transcriptional regulator [Egicoccus sp.]HSK22695.1 LuxR C-terminal-related transcriptional regulator [Egicoccus sp.]
MAAAVLIVINGLGFASVGFLAAVLFRRDESDKVRRISMIVSICCVAFMLGSVHRLGQHAARNGWIEAIQEEQWATEIQLARSIVVLALTLVALIILKRVASDIRREESTLRALTGLVGTYPELHEVNLTPREHEVLSLMGFGLVSDEHIASRLVISPHTARTHVRNIMKKAGVASRRDLVVLTLRSSSHDSSTGSIPRPQ